MGNVQTRQFDARGMAHRRGSISWNFRYPTIRRRDRSTMMIFNSKLSVSDWLDLLDLQQYEGNLNMYNCVEDILELNDSDLKRKGVRHPGHRAKMLSSLVGVQAKRRQSMNIEVPSMKNDLARRKNSCPHIYLSESGGGGVGLFDSHTISRNSSYRNSLAMGNNPNPRNKKRLTIGGDESMMIYETVESPESIPSQPRSPSCAEESTAENNMDYGATVNALGHSPNGGTDSSQSQYSNEQQEAVALKKSLEWELSLDSRDLRSHAWYHGPLPRQRAEEIVQREGDFLIRDCVSQPGNYVLSCRTKTTVLHFVINKILLQPETVYEHVQYQFEEDAFDAVPDLITFYVGSGKPISAASGARIQYPCNRPYPLSFYGHKIVGNQLHTQMLAGIRGASPLNSPLSSNGGFRFGPSTGQQMPQQQQQLQPNSPLSSPPRIKRDTAPRLPSKKQRSQSLTPAQAMVVSNMKHSNEAGASGEGVDSGSVVAINGNGFKEVRRFSHFEKCHSISGSPSESQLNTHMEFHPTLSKVHTNGFQTIARCSASELIDHVKFTTHSLPRPTGNAFRGNFGRVSSLARDFSTDSGHFSTSLEGKNIPELPEKPPSPPPKPIRAPSLPRKEKDLALEQQQQQQQQQHLHRAAYHASGSDSGNGSGDSVHSSIPGDAVSEFTMQRGVIIKNPRFMSNSSSSATLKSLSEFDVVAAEEQLFSMDLPEFKLISKFDIENFGTLLLPSVDNKPLDGGALSTFKMMLLETGPKMIAEHITRIDIGLLIDEPNPEDGEEHSVLECCGLEMLTMPQGKVLRCDLIERTQCMKLMVAVTILTCQTDLDRAEILSKWIQIAVETKNALGNLFGFCAIMLGLCMQQIQKLDQAWHILRQKYTDSAFTFEAKLRPTLISMNECSNPQAPNTTIPHVLLYALLKDRPILDILSFNNASDKSSLYTTCITSWESKADDFGMTIHFLHLDSARGFLRNLHLFRKNARVILEESTSRLDELLSDAFRTEFQVKFLWGSNGAIASAEDRHSKLEKVLGMMSDKFCNADNTVTTAA